MNIWQKSTKNRISSCQLLESFHFLFFRVTAVFASLPYQCVATCVSKYPFFSSLLKGTYTLVIALDISLVSRTSVVADNNASPVELSVTV